jgi:hypothetical protein
MDALKAGRFYTRREINEHLIPWGRTKLKDEIEHDRFPKPMPKRKDEKPNALDLWKGSDLIEWRDQRLAPGTDVAQPNEPKQPAPGTADQPQPKQAAQPKQRRRYHRSRS